MKPTSQISQKPRSHRGEETSGGLRLTHPVTDSNYQPTGGDFRVATDRNKQSRRARFQSFRQVSKEFFAVEMKRDYLTEAACFVILIGVSAWPIVSMVRALSWLK